MNAADVLTDAAERGLVPDVVVRAGIRQFLRERLRDLDRGDCEANQAAFEGLLAAMRISPIAEDVDSANAQHYEVPAGFFELILGPRLKYSCCLWTPGADLSASEDAMLALTCERAGIADGQRVLDLGCGWGSLSLWIAERYPACEILAVSNSDSQRRFIESAAVRRSLVNLAVRTVDMNRFDPGARFDRVVSVEMFEHMRNWEALLARVAAWLAPEGRAFVHVFCHREQPYFFERDGRNDWMARHFFSGGVMPADSMIYRCQRDLQVERHWRVAGTHYALTLRSWLARLDGRRAQVDAMFRGVYGAADAARCVQRWRLFLLACAEMFAYRDGREWWVSHYRLAPREGAGEGA